MTLQQQYNLIKEGKGDKAHFLKNAKFQFPNLFNAYTSYEDSVNVLKGKGLIAESVNGVGGVVTGGREQDWVKIFKQNISEEVKAEEKKTSKEVEDILAHNFDYKDDKNIDNVYGQTFLHGFYTEMQDPKNEAKTVDEIKEIVRKNLAANRLYYTEDGMFGVKGVGYTTEAPGLGTPKEPKGKYKSSGYGDLREGLGMSMDQRMLQPKNIALNVVDNLPSNYTDEDLAGAIDSYLTQAAVSPEVYDRDIKPNFGEWMTAIKAELTKAAMATDPGAGAVGDMLRGSIARSTQMEELKAAIREIILQELNEGAADEEVAKAEKEVVDAKKKAAAAKLKAAQAAQAEANAEEKA
jgi:hypothetical protein